MAGRFSSAPSIVQLMLMADKNGENNMLCCFGVVLEGSGGVGGGRAEEWSGERARRQGSHFFTASAFVYL